MVQNIIVFLIVLFAVIYMVRKLYMQIKGKGGCDCSSCSSCSVARKLREKAAAKKEKDGNGCSCCKKD